MHYNLFKKVLGLHLSRRSTGCHSQNNLGLYTLRTAARPGAEPPTIYSSTVGSVETFISTQSQNFPRLELREHQLDPKEGSAELLQFRTFNIPQKLLIQFYSAVHSGDREQSLAVGSHQKVHEQTAVDFDKCRKKAYSPQTHLTHNLLQLSPFGRYYRAEL